MAIFRMVRSSHILPFSGYLVNFKLTSLPGDIMYSPFTAQQQHLNVTHLKYKENWYKSISYINQLVIPVFNKVTHGSIIYINQLITSVVNKLHIG